MAKRERSAGVLVFRSTKTGRKYLLLDYGRHWDFPKGHVEPGEDLIQTALRELEEETGITDAAVIPGFSHEIKYFFRDKKKHLIHKTVWFGLAQTAASKVRLSNEHVGSEFLGFDQAIKRLTYAAAKSLLRHAEEFLNRNSAKDGNNRPARS
jgi:8-oxo-dGTP pyrophosphatase MutT (NUDIX family)